MQDLIVEMEKYPEVWFKSLVSSGQMAELVDLEASVQSALGTKIEKQLRLGKLAQQLAIAVDQRDVVLSKTALNKADVSRCIVNLVEVQEALRGGVDSLIPRDTLAEVQALLSSTLQATMEQLVTSLGDHKTKVKDLCLRLAPLQEAVVADNYDVARPIVHDPTLEATVQNAVAGSCMTFCF